MSLAALGRSAATGAGVVALAAALVLGSSMSASAHDQLVSSVPAAGTEVTVVPDVTLTFNDDVLDLGDAGSASIVQVTDASGLHFETGCATTNRKVVTVPVALGGVGDYTVSYSIVSADGHRVAADLKFTYAPADGTASAPGTTKSPCAAVASNESSSSVSDGNSTTTIVLWVAGGIIGLAIVGVVLALVLTRRKPGAQA